MENIEAVRKLIRIHIQTQKRLHNLMQLGQWINETELIREALNIGIDNLEKKKYESKRISK